MDYFVRIYYVVLLSFIRYVDMDVCDMEIYSVKSNVILPF